MVNAPASPSEVTLPEDGPGGSGGSPRLRGLWEACLEGLQPHFGFCRTLLRDFTRPGAPGAWGRAGSRGQGSGMEVSRTRGLVLSNLILFAPASPELPGTQMRVGLCQ